jgi:hypothetical protein
MGMQNVDSEFVKNTARKKVPEKNTHDVHDTGHLLNSVFVCYYTIYSKGNRWTAHIYIHTRAPRVLTYCSNKKSKI